jgi:ribose transport system substrate-binding protein
MSVRDQMEASSPVAGGPSNVVGWRRPRRGRDNDHGERAMTLGLGAESSRRGFLKTALGGSAVLLGTGGLSSLLAACGGSGAGGGKLLMASSLRDFAIGAEVDWDRGAKAFAKQMGMEDQYQTMLCQGDTQKQISQVKDFLTKAGPGNAILGIDPNDTSAVEPLVQLCKQNKAYCWTFATRPEGVLPTSDNPYWTYGAFDPAEQVNLVMEVMLAQFDGPTKFLLLNGDRSHSKAIYMNKVLEGIAASDPKLDILTEEYVPGWDRNAAQTIMKTLLVKHGDVQALWCANDGIALGALQALNEAGISIPVSGIDADAEAVEKIISGEMTATVSQQMPRVGFYSLAITYAAHKGVFDPADEPPEHRAMSLKNTLITKDNAADYKAQYLDAMPKYDPDDIWVESTGKPVTDF